jgi:MFS transporter, DHA1 family, tetracycline resistance protein
MTTPAPTAARQPALGFIFVTVVTAVLGFGLLIPVLPDLVKQFQGGDTAAGAHMYGVLIGVYALMQFVGSPILGSLSDRFGRRKVILIALAGSSIDYMVMAWAPTLGWLFVARVISGVTGGVLATANAYVADVTPPEKRAQGFGIIGAAFGLGFVIGPLLGGILGQYDLRLPFWGAAACAALNWLYGYFVLPESLAPQNRRAFSWKRANPVGSLMALRRFPAVLGLAESYFILSVAQQMLFSIWVLYTGYRYHWGRDQVGYSLAAVGVISSVVQAGLAKRIIGRIGDVGGVIAGLTLSAVAQLSYGLAPQGWMVYGIIFVGAFAGIAGPAMQSYITKHVPPNEQGAVQGIFAGLQSLAGIFAPLIATWSFGWAISSSDVRLPALLSFLDGTVNWTAVHVLPRHPGLSFFEAAMLMLVAMALAVRSFRKDRPPPAAGPATAA